MAHRPKYELKLQTSEMKTQDHRDLELGNGLTTIISSERCLSHMTTLHLVKFNLYKTPRIGKSIKIKSRLLFAWAWWGEEEEGMPANGCEILLGIFWLLCPKVRLWRCSFNSVKILKFIEFCTLKQVNSILCELDFNEKKMFMI